MSDRDWTEIVFRAVNLMSHGAMSWSASLPTIPTTSSSESSGWDFCF